MAASWRQTTLGEIGDIVTGKTPPAVRAEYFSGDIPFVTPSDFDGRRKIDATVRSLSESGAASIGRVLVPPNAVMVSCIGSDMGKAAMSTFNCVTNQQINSLIVGPDADPQFVYYDLSRRKEEMRRLASGSAQPILNKSAFGRLTIFLPPLPEQRAIASILGALDDKIEVNRKISATLEAIARALFKSWFVDFDPVRAKAEGRDPGLDADIAALFPDSFEDSELGEIPKGWSVEPIVALAEIVGGGTPSTSEPAYWDGPFAWVTPKDLAALKTPVLLSTNRTISEQGLSTISSGLLPIGTLLLSSRAPIGYLAVAELPVAINQGFIAMKAREEISNLFLLRWSESAHDDILARANGSTFLEISKSNFRPIPVVVPVAPLMRAFDDIARPLHDRLVLSELESRSLVALRDALLPQLISGEVRVSST